jgi:hypothetical protein
MPTLAIIDGTRVTLDDPVAQQTVFLGIKTKWNSANFCTGVILSQKIILTAAHCIQPASEIYVLFGPSIDFEALKKPLLEGRLVNSASIR